MNIKDITITRSRRKTIVLGIDRDLNVYVRAPLRCPNSQIQRFLDEKQPWLEKHMAQMRERLAEEERTALPPLTEAELLALAAQAKEYIPRRVEHFAAILGARYGRVTIRHQRSRWGSCSSKGNLSFNCLLMLTPPEVIDYVVAHELCHLLEMNHSPDFYAHVAALLPDYKARQTWLKGHGGAILRRLPK